MRLIDVTALDGVFVSLESR